MSLPAIVHNYGLLSSTCDRVLANLSICLYGAAGRVRIKYREDSATFPGRIRIAMSTAGIHTAAELARRMKVNRQTVHRWINGEGIKLTPEMLFSLSDALKANPRWLIFGAPHSPVMPKELSPEDAEVIEVYKSIPHPTKDTWLSNGRDLIRILTPASAGNPFPTRRK